MHAAARARRRTAQGRAQRQHAHGLAIHRAFRPSPSQPLVRRAVLIHDPATVTGAHMHGHAYALRPRRQRAVLSDVCGSKTGAGPGPTPCTRGLRLGVWGAGCSLLGACMKGCYSAPFPRCLTARAASAEVVRGARERCRRGAQAAGATRRQRTQRYCGENFIARTSGERGQLPRRNARTSFSEVSMSTCRERSGAAGS
eukprot:361274-Chlamydomonas_euryale.AAC.5